MAELVKVASLSELKEGEIKAVNVGGIRIALHTLGTQVSATSDICTHAGCLLSESGYVRGEEVECGCHSSKFNIKSGEVIAEPAAEPLKTYPVKIVGEDVFVEV